MKRAMAFLVGLITARRCCRASWKETEPVIASAVSAATSSFLPRKAAISSMDSSVQKDESTSKQTSCERGV